MSGAGHNANEALFLAELDRVTDADGDVAALFARDDTPEEFRLFLAGGAA